MATESRFAGTPSPTATMSDAQLRAAHPRAWLWPVGLAALMLGSIGICAVTVVLAVRDESHSLEPDYYAKAVAWDQTAAQRDANARLGWRPIASVSSPNAAGQRTLDLTLTDATGAPIAAERIEVVAFHHARSREQLSLTSGAGAPAQGSGAATHAEPGHWSWSIGPGRAGVWQVRLRAVRDQDTFTAVLDVETPDGGR